MATKGNKRSGGGAKALVAGKRGRKAKDETKVPPAETKPASTETATPPAATVVPHEEVKKRRGGKAAEAAAALPAAQRAEHYRELVCALTDEEVARKSNEMAAAVGRRHKIEAERREYAARTRADLKGLTGQVEQLAEQVRSRAESRPVRCKTVSDTERKKVAVFRLDTEECLDVRDMTEQEAARAREEPPRQLGADAVAAIRAWERHRGKFAQAPAAAKAEKDPPAPPAASPGFSLAEVPGLSAAARKALELAEYGTLAALRVATSRDLCAVAGVGEATAQRVLLYVEENYPPAAGEPAAVTEEERRLATAGEVDEPADEEQLRKTAAELAEILDGEGEEREERRVVPVEQEDREDDTPPVASGGSTPFDAIFEGD
jgi:hypothetical protein